MIALTDLDFQNSSGLPRSAASQILKFEREDLTSFRTVEGLEQKAGVAGVKLRRLVLKEIADNGLDNGTDVRIGELRTAATSSRTTAPASTVRRKTLRGFSASRVR